MSETTNLYSSGFTQRLFVEPDYGASLERGGKRRCLGCMHLYDAEFDMCPYCGYVVNTEIEYASLLRPGSKLNQKYLVGRSIGFSDFWAVYLAWDTEYKRKVAIKEYLPKELSIRALGQNELTIFPGEKEIHFENGLTAFRETALQLAKYRRESAVVTVFDFFEENRTAYVVMELLEGESLEDRLGQNGKMSFEKAYEILSPIMDVLNILHEDGMVHMNISPENIFFTEKGETKLIDFGTAKHATVSAGRKISSLVNKGYSAEEMYQSRSNYEASTDVYSVAAVLYRMLTGMTPADAFERRLAIEKGGKDILDPIEKLASGLTTNQVTAIKNSLNVYSENRTQNIVSFIGELFSEEKIRRKKQGIKRIDRLKWPLWLKIATISVLAVSLVFATLLVTGVIGPESGLDKAYSVPSGKTVVPNVQSMDKTDAEKILSDNNLQLVLSDAKTNDFVSKDTVVNQYPEAGSIVNYGEVIRVTVSSGPGMALVKDVTGFSVEKAREVLEESGFRVVTREEDNSDYARDVVYNQSVSPSEQEKGTEITLYVSKGNSSIITSTEVEIPGLIGADYESAMRSLRANALYVAITEITNNRELPDGQIVSQKPREGEKGHAGEIITITVNRTDDDVYVPDVYGTKKEDAVKQLEDLGFKVEIQESSDKSVEKDTVISQSVRRGSLIRVGSRITLTVSNGYSAVVPDVRGKSVEEAQKLLIYNGFSSCVADVTKDAVVVGQSVKPGQEAELGTLVSLETGNES